jgi:hypothetical protein
MWGISILHGVVVRFQLKGSMGIIAVAVAKHFRHGVNAQIVPRSLASRSGQANEPPVAECP